MDNNSNALYLEIAKFKAGNFADYQSFYNLTSGYIYNLILAVVKDANAAANVNNLVYDRIYKSIGQLTDDSFFYQWAGTIATDESLNYLLQNGLFSVQAVAPDASDNMYSALDMFADTESYISADFMADEEKKRIVNEVISALSPVQQLVLQYYFYEGLRIADIAYRLKLSNTGVKQIIEQIKHAIKPYVGGIDGQTKLKTIGELPFVWMLFASATGVPATVGIFGVRAATVGAAGAAGVATNMAGNGATGGTIGAGMAGSGVAGAGMTGGVAGTGAAGSVGAVGAATGTAASGVGVAAAGTAAKVGLGIGAKVAIGVAGAAVVVGGGIGAFKLINKPDKEPAENVQTVTDATTEEITTEEIVTEEPTTEEVVLSDMEILKAYLDETIITSYGISNDVEQTGQVASNYMDFGNNVAWLDIGQVNGVLSTYIDDFDSDGSDEMVVFYMAEMEYPVKRGYDYDEMNNTIATDISYDGRASELKYDLYSVENGEVVLSDSNDFRYLNTYFDSMNGRVRYDELPTIVYDDISEDIRLFMTYTTDDNGQKCFVLEYRHTGGMGYTDVCNYHKCALFKVEDDTFIPYAYAASNASHQTSGVLVVADMDNYVATNVQSQPNVNTVNSESYEADGYAIWRSFMDSRGFARAKCVAWSAIGFEYEQSSTDSILDLELDNAILFSLNVYVADEGDWTSTPCIMGYQTNIYDRQGLLGR